MIVLDTHTLIWWIAADKRLSHTALTAIEAAMDRHAVLVSSISTWEIAMLVLRKRIALAYGTIAWIKQVGKLDGLRFVAVDNNIAIGAVELPGNLHKDPADRIIVATTRAFDATLVTNDQKIRAYPHVRSVW